MEETKPSVIDLEWMGQLDNIYHKSFLLRGADGRYFRASRSMCLALQLMDGERTLSQIADDCRSLYHLTIDDADLQKIVQHKLLPAGLIEGPSSDHPRFRFRPKRPRYKVSVRIGLLPASQVKVLARPLGWLCHPRRMVSLSLLSLLAHVIFYSRHPLDQVLTQTGHSSLDWLIPLAMLLILFVHELGHAAVSLFWNAEPGAIGVGLYLVFPIAWTDLNSSWKLKRSQRAAIDLGGVYLQWLVSMTLIALSYFSPFQWMVVVVVWNDLAILFNLLPFLRLDGYWLLSDWMGIPNLNQEIWDALKNMIRWRKSKMQSHLQGFTRIAFYLCLVLTGLIMPFVLFRIWFFITWSVQDLPAEITAWFNVMKTADFSWATLINAGTLGFQVLIKLCICLALASSFVAPLIYYARRTPSTIKARFTHRNLLPPSDPV